MKLHTRQGRSSVFSPIVISKIVSCFNKGEKYTGKGGGQCCFSISINVVKTGGTELAFFVLILSGSLQRRGRPSGLTTRGPRTKSAIPRLGIPRLPPGVESACSRRHFMREQAVPGGRVVRGSLRLLPEGAPLSGMTFCCYGLIKTPSLSPLPDVNTRLPSRLNFPSA
jgi:hypothetical protein